MCPTCIKDGRLDTAKIDNEESNTNILTQSLQTQVDEHQILTEKRFKEIGNLKSRKETLRAENSSQAKQLEDKRTKRVALEDKLSVQKKDLAAMKQRIATLEKHETTLHTTITQQASTISSQKLLINEYKIKAKSHFDLAFSFMEEVVVVVVVVVIFSLMLIVEIHQ